MKGVSPLAGTQHEVQQPQVFVLPADASWDWLSPMISLIVAGGTVLAVHRLTQSREKDKGVNELNWKVVDCLNELRGDFDAGLKEASPNGARLVLEAQGKLQHIGGLVERMRIYSRYRVFWKPWIFYQIGLTREMRILREALTGDEVAAVTKRNAAAVAIEVDQAILAFNTALSTCINRWIGGQDPS